MANNKFLIQKLPDGKRLDSGLLALENRSTTYKYEMTNNGSEVIRDGQKIANTGAVWSYINSISSTYADDIKTEKTKLVDGNAVHDYIDSISSHSPTDIIDNGTKLVDGNAVYDFVQDVVQNRLQSETWTFYEATGATGGSVDKQVYIYTKDINKTN